MDHTLLAATTIRMERPIANRFINDDITIADLDIVQASRVCTDPSFVLDRSSLAAKIRKRNQITFTTFATAGKCILHEIASFLLSRIVIAYLTTETKRGLAIKLAEGEPPPLH